MMYGPKGSDSLIVPEKLANKAGRPVAESMEGSGGIEGNAELQKHGPDAEPGGCETGAEPHTEEL